METEPAIHELDHKDSRMQRSTLRVLPPSAVMFEDMPVGTLLQQGDLWERRDNLTQHEIHAHFGKPFTEAEHRCYRLLRPIDKNGQPCTPTPSR